MHHMVPERHVTLFVKEALQVQTTPVLRLPVPQLLRVEVSDAASAVGGSAFELAVGRLAAEGGVLEEGARSVQVAVALVAALVLVVF